MCRVGRLLTYSFAICRLSAYGCLTTGLDEGLIEIVTPASTIAKIQLENPGMSKVSSAFNKLCIYQWLQKHNTTKERHVDELRGYFTAFKSCLRLVHLTPYFAHWT